MLTSKTVYVHESGAGRVSVVFDSEAGEPMPYSIEYGPPRGEPGKTMRIYGLMENDMRYIARAIDELLVTANDGGSVKHDCPADKEGE